MSLLEGQLAAAVYAGFKGKLLVGTLRREVATESAGLDNNGDMISPTPVTWGMEGFPDDYTDFARAQAGIPEEDLKVCIFGMSLAGGSVRPLKDDQATFGGGVWYQVRKVGTDPAKALWVCQSFVIKPPVDP